VAISCRRLGRFASQQFAFVGNVCAHGCYQREALAGHNHRNTMDRIYIAIIASALVILLGAAGLLVTRTEILHHARSAELID
jgi:hypothetical protein